MEFQYTTVPGKIKPLLAKIREVGVPAKANIQWLKSLGFTSSNDYSLIGVLKALRFIDGSNVPTRRWSEYRGANFKTVLGDALREGYSDLFAVYPDAHQRSTTDLEHVFSTSSTGGRQVIAKTVSTFKSLAELAEFPATEEQGDLHLSAPALHVPAGAAPSPSGPTKSQNAPSLHVDVQVHISPDASTDQIDQIFASMAKHLYGSGK